MCCGGRTDTGICRPIAALPGSSTRSGGSARGRTRAEREGEGREPALLLVVAGNVEKKRVVVVVVGKIEKKKIYNIAKISLKLKISMGGQAAVRVSDGLSSAEPEVVAECALQLRCIGDKWNLRQKFLNLLTKLFFPKT